MFEAGAPIAPATFEAGAPRQPTIEAISSSRDGILDTASTPHYQECSHPLHRRRISNFEFSLANPWATLAAATGSSEYVRTVIPSKGEPCLRMVYLPKRFWRACFWQRELNTRPLGHARADLAFQQLLDLCNGQPLQRQSCQRFGRALRPLSLFVLYPQFHSNYGDHSPAQFCR